VPGRATCPQMQIGKPSLPEHGAIASQAGDGDRERLLQTSKTGEGRAPVRSAELESGDGDIAAVPADDLPGERVGLGRPGDSQLITTRPNNAEGIPTRAGAAAPGGGGSASMPLTTGCWLTAHRDASDPSDDPSPREPVLSSVDGPNSRARTRGRRDRERLLRHQCAVSSNSASQAQPISRRANRRTTDPIRCSTKLSTRAEICSASSSAVLAWCVFSAGNERGPSASSI
jgi:hypothetical protein